MTQLDNENLEQPITFFSEGLKDHEIKYSYVEKQVLVARELKKIRHMLSNNRIQLMVLYGNIKEFLLSRDINEKGVGWVTRVMEYDVDIKITKLVRGKGLCEQLFSAFETLINVSLVLQEDQLLNIDTQNSWVNDMTTILKEGRYPPSLDRTKRRHFKLQSIPYVIMDGILFRKDLNGVLLRCIE